MLARVPATVHVMPKAVTNQFQSTCRKRSVMRSTNHQQKAQVLNMNS
jgi:hypothetical protein